MIDGLRQFRIDCVCVCVSGGGSEMDRWRWPRPDVEVYTMLVNGLAASLRVSDSLRIITDICRVGISPAEEVSKQFIASKT